MEIKSTDTRNVRTFIFRTDTPTGLYQEQKDIFNKHIETPYFGYSDKKEFINNLDSINRINKSNTVGSTSPTFIFFHLYFGVETKVVNKGDWFINVYGELKYCDDERWAEQLNDVKNQNPSDKRYLIIASSDITDSLPAINSLFVEYYALSQGKVRQDFSTRLYLYGANPDYVNDLHKKNAEPKYYTMEILAQTFEEAKREAALKRSSNYFDAMMQLETNKSFQLGVEWAKTYFENNPHALNS